jgi:MoaA/NifB/PqqE/SkfB family radical SAM enzyme
MNFLIKASWEGGKTRSSYLNNEDLKVPYALLISPTMRCNLRCSGCYAGKYSKNDDLTIQQVDNIITEAKALGTYFFVILGGEPFIYDNMMEIYKLHSDCIFAVFTNGTLFDERMCDQVLELGNVVPMFSLEGFKQSTDERRGEGTFDKVMDAMDMLNERGVLFGVSTATTRYNKDEVVSDEFIDMLIEKGSKISWYFSYMPVGKDPDVELMLTPKQRIDLGKDIIKIRNEKPYFAIDFFNDAPFVGGCIAAKYYMHINSKGDVEPCIFSHFACDNIHEKTYVEVLKSPFFKSIRTRQPYNHNLLKPCMMIDNPHIIREIVTENKAYPTHDGADRMIVDEEFITELEKKALDFDSVANNEWLKRFEMDRAKEKVC